MRSEEHRELYHNFFQKGNGKMKKLKLCNVHKLALSNEGEGRKPIHIPFGTWAYDDTIDQTLDREHAEKIAADLAGKVAAGEPGIPVYQGHPDVPEYASKYPDKGALGWVKRILVNEDGMDLEVEWDRDPGKGFGWFSPHDARGLKQNQFANRGARPREFMGPLPKFSRESLRPPPLLGRWRPGSLQRCALEKTGMAPLAFSLRFAALIRVWPESPDGVSKAFGLRPFVLIPFRV